MKLSWSTQSLVKLLLILSLSCYLTGCGAIISRAVSGLADNLTKAILDNDDPDTVKEGIPAYLLMLDAMVITLDDAATRLAAARLYGSYAGGFVTEPERAKRLTTISFDYALAGLCQDDPSSCGVYDLPLEGFQAWVASIKPDQIENIYTVAVAWVGWIQAHAEDWNAIADLAKVKLMMDLVLQIDESIDYAGPHLYYGVFETLLPAALGGRPELGREHFERAIALSEGRYLMTKVLFARQYARLVYDRELHDQLLKEVLAANPELKGSTVINRLAQMQAKELLESADDHF